ncbi:hypothetical protein BU202_01490 [Streptococcus cuniculi]|uniref:Uncharacterized protein n=1 Tax=Streptococcus cuniculi TaxID=1432788 RepID=A0A1Q8EB22_9STRE|nr:hypothetical protein [Streptococcus cuniculi]OLF48984.1 hypothetical protein BU202_01490 [Streptococcus cuniculi]
MAVVFFRNQLDANMKRFGKFSKNIVQRLSTSHNVRMVYSSRKIDYISSLNPRDTFVIISHGSSKEIYHRFKKSGVSHQNLLDTVIPPRSAGKIIAVSCGTARDLGPKYVQNGLCKAYLGFSTKLHFDKKQSQYKFVSPYYSRELKEIYKSVFEKVLTQAILNKWTFEKTARVMKFELRKLAMQRLQKIKREYPHYYQVKEISQILVAVASVANGIKVLGNSNETVS